MRLRAQLHTDDLRDHSYHGQVFNPCGDADRYSALHRRLKRSCVVMPSFHTDDEYDLLSNFNRKSREG